MKLLTRSQWDAVWSTTDPLTVGRRMPLMEFAKHCNVEAAKRRKQYPGLRFDNGRYVCHLEQHLAAGTVLPPAILATVTADDLRYDWPSFPHLAPLLGFPARAAMVLTC